MTIGQTIGKEIVEAAAKKVTRNGGGFSSPSDVAEWVTVQLDSRKALLDAIFFDIEAEESDMSEGFEGSESGMDDDQESRILQFPTMPDSEDEA